MGGRGDSVHNYLPFLGSAVAPIFGAFVGGGGAWRWIFWGTSVVSVAALAPAFLCLDETYHPVLLERKAARRRRETGNPRLRTPFQAPGQSRRAWWARKAALPYLMLLAHPVVYLPFGYRAYLFGIMYLMCVVVVVVVFSSRRGGSRGGPLADSRQDVHLRQELCRVLQHGQAKCQPELPGAGPRLRRRAAHQPLRHRRGT